MKFEFTLENGTASFRGPGMDKQETTEDVPEVLEEAARYIQRHAHHSERYDERGPRTVENRAADLVTGEDPATLALKTENDQLRSSNEMAKRRIANLERDLDAVKDRLLKHETPEELRTATPSPSTVAETDTGLALRAGELGRPRLPGEDFTRQREGDNWLEGNNPPKPTPDTGSGARPPMETGPRPSTTAEQGRGAAPATPPSSLPSTSPTAVTKPGEAKPSDDKR